MSAVVDLETRRRQHAGAHVDERAEAAVLTCVLFAAECLDELAELRPEHFATPRWRACFAAMQRVHARRDPLDALTLRSELLARHELDQVGEAAIVALMEHLPPTLDVEPHARRVLDLALVRDVLSAAHSILVRAQQPIDDAAAFAREAEASIARAAQTRAQGAGPVSMRHAVTETVERLTEAMERMRDGLPVGDVVPTRFPGLNRKLGGGYRAGELHLIAARPGMGKTALGLDVALSMALTSPGVFFSLEMTRDELTRRGLVSHGRIDGGRLRTHVLTDEDWRRLVQAGGALAELGVHIDDTAAVTLSYVRSTLRRHQARHGLGWAVIDYLGLMRGDQAHLKREEQIGSISRGLKELAKELGIPVLALAQLNREVERRSGKERRPQLADLRDSGSLEQDADSVSFIHREEVYRRDDPTLRGKAEIIISKQRGGPTGTVECRFVHEHMRFEEVADDWRAAPPDMRDDGGGDEWGSGFDD